MSFKIVEESCECCVMQEDGFINLHLHTAFSLLDGMSKPEDVVKKIKGLGQRGFAVTEHGNVHSSVKMYKLAKENSLKFVYACEFYICEDRFKKGKTKEEKDAIKEANKGKSKEEKALEKEIEDADPTKKYYHITILAKNEQGRLNINKLVSLGYLEGFYSKPRIDFNLLEQNKDGLIVLSGCMASEVQQALAGGKIGSGDITITENNIDKAKGIIQKYRHTFGEDYYLEVQSHRDYRQQKLNRAIVDIGLDLGIQWVATADSHFVNEEDLELHKIFIAINRNKDTYEDDETYLDTQIQSEKEAWNLLQSLTEPERDIAIRNTQHILDKTNSHIPLSAPLIPKMEIPKEFKTQEDYLKHLCNLGWIMRKIHKLAKEERDIYRTRLTYEFDAISEMGFAGYYLLVHGYATSVRRRGIARGSGGGSLVAYLLNIVDIDPVEHGLYFERFIDVAQLDMLADGSITRAELKIPDFDLDFGTKEREFIVENLVKEHGQSRVAALGQFGYIWDKSAIKDVGRVLGIPFDVTNQITKELDDGTIEESIDKGTFKKYYSKHKLNEDETDEEMEARSSLYEKLFRYAKSLAGLPRSFGKHACGKVVTINEVMFYTGVLEKDGEIVLQVDMKDAEDLGGVKVDVLGLRTVDVIYDTLDMIGKDVEYIRNLEYSNDEVLSIFKGAHTDGVFQFESDGMKATMKSMQPRGLDDLSAVNALYRPGSMKFIDNYIARMHGLEEFEYLHPDLESILGKTYGIIVFQEQLIDIGRMAKMRNPDLLRQATGKKDIKKLKLAEPQLRKGLYDRGWTVEQVDELMEIMIEFAKYSFNKAHSQAYAIIAFICAFLKIHHPLEFMCAWFNSLVSHHDKIEVCHKEMKRLGITINKPSYKNVSNLCRVEKGGINYGTSLIKHIGKEVGEELSNFSRIRYKHFIDLLIDIQEQSSIDKKQLDILIRFGYFSQFGEPEKLLRLYSELTEGKNRYYKKLKENTKIKRLSFLHDFEETFNEELEKILPNDIILFERDKYGFIQSTFPDLDNKLFSILDIDTKYTPRVTCYRFSSGETVSVKVKRDKFFGKKDIEPFGIGDTIKIKKTSTKNKNKKVDGKWIPVQGEFDYFMETCSKTKMSDFTLQIDKNRL